ncbi:unnamed protein product [Protopolystoma xenopodis]|uniref:Uncharacterized protein n=1 Tax=Protopolystoma xenopodis TaxID=117903 RepID=A0A448WCF3_9PLAT|nr:unnamed protein product [Protopolystoma xenopodis]
MVYVVPLTHHFPSDIKPFIAVDEEHVLRVSTFGAGVGRLMARVFQWPSGEPNGEVDRLDPRNISLLSDGSGPIELPVEIDSDDVDQGNTVNIYFTPTMLGHVEVELRYGGILIPNGKFSQADRYFLFFTSSFPIL